MSMQMVLLPVFVQVGLIFVLLFAMGFARLQSLKARELKISDIALGQNVWPERSRKVGNAFNNQFEMPILFFAITALALITKQTDLLFVVMAWLFVALRIAHAFVHTTSNHVPTRFNLYFAGCMVLMLMWIIFAFKILFA